MALVAELLEKADETKGDAVARFALLQEAKKLAAEAEQGTLAFEVIDVLASEYWIRAAEMKAEIVEQATKRFHSLHDRKVAAEAALEVVNEAIAEEDFETARRIGKQAIQIAPPTKENRELLRAIQTKNKEMETAAKISADAKQAMVALKKDPGDPAANSIVGRYLCIAKDDWEKGLPLLARGSNAKLKALAEKDMHAPATAAEQVELGDGWWVAGGKQRAAFWYEQAMPRLKMLDRAHVIGVIRNEPLGGRPVDLLAWTDPEKDEADGQWGDWARKGTDAVCTALPPLTDEKQDDFATLALPVEVYGQYDLRVSFTRNKAGTPGHDEIVVDFPVGLHYCAFSTGKLGSGLGNIDHKKLL